MNQQAFPCVQHPVNSVQQTDFFFGNQQYYPNQNHFNPNPEHRNASPPRTNIGDPIFILPQQQVLQGNPSVPMVQPYIIPIYLGIPPSNTQTTYIPYPVPISTCNYPRQHCNSTNVTQPFCGTDASHQEEVARKSSSNFTAEHTCCQGNNETVCVKKDCPAALSLQALASQFLSVQGIISCAVTRILLKRIPGSNIMDSDDDILDRAGKNIDDLGKDQLLVESRSTQQLNSFINLHMTMKPPVNILPLLTLIQLKVNSLKARVDNKINQMIMENQGMGAESSQPLDEQNLSVKSNEDLRELMACLKQKEMNEKTNLTIASHPLQRSVVENHLNNIKLKIVQVEDEFERRRRWDGSTPRRPFPISNDLSKNNSNSSNDFQFESFEPLLIQIRNGKRLRMKPHVGCPETTYRKPANNGDDSARPVFEEAKTEEPSDKKSDGPSKDSSNDGSKDEESTKENDSLVVFGRSIDECFIT